MNKNDTHLRPQNVDMILKRTRGGRGQKSEIFANVVYEWPLSLKYVTINFEFIFEIFVTFEISL